MNKYDIVAFDMDGTLLNSGKQICGDSLAAISKAVSMGKHVALSTGRSIPELERYMETLKDVHYFICSSGALIYDNKKHEIIYSRIIDRRALLKVFEISKKYNLMCHIHSEQSVVQRDQGCRLKDFNMGIYQNMFNKNAVFVDNLYKWYKEHDVPVYKFDCYCADHEIRDLLYEDVKSLDVTLAYSEITSLEFSPYNTSKATGLEYICKILDIPLERAIAVGDSENDIPILQKAGLGVAMGNAKPIVKEAADAVVKDNDNGGCAQVISDYLLSCNL